MRWERLRCVVYAERVVEVNECVPLTKSLMSRYFPPNTTNDSFKWSNATMCMKNGLLHLSLSLAASEQNEIVNCVLTQTSQHGKKILQTFLFSSSFLVADLLLIWICLVCCAIFCYNLKYPLTDIFYCLQFLNLTKKNIRRELHGEQTSDKDFFHLSPHAILMQFCVFVWFFCFFFIHIFLFICWRALAVSTYWWCWREIIKKGKTIF